MTILELLKQIRRFDGNLSREQNQRYYELETKIETLQAEHEALKKDVARYLDLQILDRAVTFEETYEYTLLFAKLRKVGK